MKKIISVFSFFLIFNIGFADEGMWLLTMLDALKLQTKGLNLSDEDIYAINQSSMKDAIVGLGFEERPFRFFCTAELVSSEGLLFTNHHCGLDLVQNHSTTSNNLLEDGFWANNHQEELPNEGITASYVVMLKDVSNEVLSAIPEDADSKEVNRIIDSISTLLIASVEDTCDYVASVKPFFNENRYYMFIYQTFKDVRLVATPPNSIGKYGGDTDNWMWPRHTGDFCVLRIYTDTLGKPAQYSSINVPYKPKYHLPISLKGYDKGDFAMIMGFPGSTERYATSYNVEQTLNILNKEAIAIRTMKLNVYKKYMETNPALKIRLSTKWQHTSNYWKYFIGQNKGIKNLNVIESKRTLENELNKWIEKDTARKQKYGGILQELLEAYERISYPSKVLQYYSEGFFNTSELLFIPYEFIGIRELVSQDTVNLEKLKMEQVLIKENLDELYEEFDLAVDLELLENIIAMYKENIDSKYHPAFYATIDKKFKGDIGAYLDKTLKKSLFLDKTKVLSLFTSSDVKQLKKDLKTYEKDPLFILMRQVIQGYYVPREEILPDVELIEKNNHLFLAALLEKNEGKLMYPDANSTLRLTYGYVGDYKPRDAVFYKHYTTLAGVIEKEDPTNDEFILDPKLKTLYQTKDYGRYGKDSTMYVCFTTNNDITGGNSGSPVINADGELIGIAFDGNWEAMSGDIIFEPELQKTINVDIRYVLFIIDKFAGATHLIDELTIHE